MNHVLLTTTFCTKNIYNVSYTNEHPVISNVLSTVRNTRTKPAVFKCLKICEYNIHKRVLYRVKVYKYEENIKSQRVISIKTDTVVGIE